MGTKRIGLARVQALIENLKRDITLGLGQGGLGGLHPQWNCNFGGLLAGEAQNVSTLNLLTPGTVALNLSAQVESLGSQSAVVSAADATKIFGGTGVVGVDVAIGTTGSPGQTPTVTQRVSRLTGDVSGTVVMTAGADMTTAGDETLILFTGNTFASSGVLKLTLNSANELDAESSEIWVTADGTDVLTRQTAPTDLDQILILTDTGDCTILAGSFIYLHAGNNTDVMSCKAVIKTSGGTIAVTYGN
jgi:hypothetical protein